MKVKELTRVGLFVALMCVFSILQLPIGPVPITLQTTMVLMTGAILGWKLGTISMGIYTLIGAIGLPVFSGMKGGLAVLVGFTGGFIIGFIIAAFVIGVIVNRRYEKAKKDGEKLMILVCAMLLGTISIYICGVLWLVIAFNYTVLGALSVGVIPFIGLDLMKLALAVIISFYIKKALAKAGLFV
jgi:biotin transport system substrate-specific component